MTHLITSMRHLSYKGERIMNRRITPLLWLLVVMMTVATVDRLFDDHAVATAKQHALDVSRDITNRGIER